MRSGQWADALQHFERATTIDPNYADAWVNQGCIWESQNNWNLARRCYERALQIDPRHSFALCNLGTVCQKTGRLEQAVEFLRRGVEIANPGDWELRHQLGLVYAQQENMPAAARWFQDAARINPQAAGVLNNLGLALWRLGRVDDARQKLEAAIAASPDFAQAHANLGMVYELLGRTADAKVHYAETLRLNPADQEIRVRLEKLQSPQ
jgi:Flp pilus assembly protein TadD